MQSQTTPHKLRQSTLSYAAGLTTAVVGLLVLVGWTLDIATLKSLLPNAVTMKANTAACFVLAGLALVLLQRSGPITGALARLCALVIALVGLFTLSEYFLGWDLGIDQMVFHESGVSLTASYPGRMAPNTALNFVLIGFAFWLLSLSRLRSNLLLEFPLIFALSISILGLLGYLTGLVELAGPAAYTQMAVHTASVFILLCTGMLFTAYRQQRAPITIEQKLFAGLTATAGVIIFISFLSVSGITTLVQASGWVDHTQQAKNQIESVLAHVLEVQSGERGFLLAGDDKYLLARKEASRGLPALMNNLRLTASDNPRQQELFASLETLVEARVAFSDQMVSTRRTEGDEEARLLFATGRGKRITDSIRVLIAQMIAEEDRLLQTRNEDETHQANRTQLIIYLSLSVQMMLLMFIFVVVNRDVTGRTKTEEVLRQKTEELDQYFTHTLDLLCIADMNGYFRRLNNAWESTLGYSLQDLEGKPFLDFVHPDDIKATLEAMSDLGAGKEVLSFTNRYRCKDGSYRWIEWRSFPAGNLIYAAARDITERKRAEEKLRESEERFRNVFENSPIGKSLTTVNGKLSVNKTFCDIVGYSAEELSKLHWKEITHPNDIEENQTIISSIIAGESDRARFQKRYIHKTGRIVWTDVSTFLQRDENGKPLFFITSISDITERKQAEETIKQNNAQLEAANKELEAFSYSVSHDLRAPLRHVSGFVDLLQKHAAATLDEKGKRYLSTITDSAKQMGMLIDDLLSFSRMGRAEMHTASVNPTALVKEVVRKLEIETKGRVIEWRIEPLPEVFGDPSMLRQVFVNLISNALKYTRTREKAIIEIGAQQNIHETVFFVRDNGVGFDMRYVDKLFGVFQRLHSSKDFEGTGIGLANVRRIITRHGGKTWAEGEVNTGATFYFSLPNNQKG